MKKLGERIRHYRLLAGLSQEELGVRCGWPPGSGTRVGNYENDKRQPSIDDVGLIAKSLGIPQYLLVLEEGELPFFTHNKNISPVMAYRYPILTWQQVESFCTSKDITGVADFLCSDISTANGFWLKVIGDSMTSLSGYSFPEGMYILVCVNSEVQSGDFVLARLANSECTFKQYIGDAGIKYLKPLNTAYKTIEMSDQEIIGKIVDARWRLIQI